MATQERDRLVDLVRPAAMLVVVLMHWTVQRVWVGPDGFESANALHGPVAVAATWVLQVMPLFFIAGGFVDTVTYDGAVGAGRGDAAFVGSRVRRLLHPTVPVLVVVALATGAAAALGHPVAARLVADHVANSWWFLVAYLGCVALTPVGVRLHDRLGWWTVPVGLALAVAADDAARAALPTAPLLGDLNVLLVWLCCHQLGVMYARGSFARVPRAGLVGVAAAAGLGIVGLVVVAGYPEVTIGLADHPRQNLMPSTLALVLLGTAQVCLMALAAPAVRRWVPSPPLARLVGAANLVLFPVFLWHLPAFFVFLGVGLAVPVLLPADEAASWAVRPVAVLVCAVVLAGFVALAVRWEVRWRRYRATDHPGRVTAGTLAGVAGTYVVWHRGMAPYGDGLDLPAVAGLTLVLLAVGLLTRRPPRTDPSAQAVGPGWKNEAHGLLERHRSDQPPARHDRGAAV